MNPLAKPRAPLAPEHTPKERLTTRSRTKLLLIDFRSGEAVDRHPALAADLRRGWQVRSARPRLTPEGTRLFVVLTLPAGTGHPAPLTRLNEEPYATPN